MLVRLLLPQRIAADGIAVRWHKTGEAIDLPRVLAEGLVRDGLARELRSDLPAAHQHKAEVVRQQKKREMIHGK